jgi:hypothetical protein
MKAVTQISLSYPTHHNRSPVAMVKTQFGQELMAKVISRTGVTPDRIRTQLGALLKRNANGFYDPE